MSDSSTALRRLPALLALALTAGLLLLVPMARPAVAADVTDGLVLRYDLDQASGTTVTDSSGNGRDGTLVGGTWGGGVLALDGVDDHVKLPNNVTAGVDAITVHLDVFVESSQATPFFLWGLGNPATSGAGTGYLFSSGNAFRAGITTGNWSGEKVTSRSSGGNLARGVWKSVTYTQTGTTGTLFEDGAQVGQNTAVTVLPSAIGGGTTTNNVLGESNYATDNSLNGRIRNFRIYDRALDASEVAQISLTDANRLAADEDALTLGDLSAVTGNLTLPTTGSFGSTITWASSAPTVITTSGAVSRPGAGEDAAEVTLTATLTRGGATATRTFVATVPADDSDQAKADAAAAAIELVHPDDVRGSLTLPTTGANGSTITWASDNPAVVAADGVVDRPANGAGDTTVTLTATVTVGSATATRAIELTVRESPAAAAYTGYAFSYFTGNSIAGEKIYFAASRGNNALKWDELNSGNPVLESTMGEMGLRDPFLIRSPEGDQFYLIATDLSIGRNGDWDRSQRTGSRYLEVWESTDLKNWSAQRHVLVSPETAGNTWAPEAYWDEDLQQFVVFWASKLYAEDDPGHTGSTYNRMLYATTRDFVTFSEAKIWQDRGESRIDSTVIKDDGHYYRFTKDEGGGGTGCSDIIQETADELTAVDLPGNPAWTMQDSCIGKNAGTSAVEGPSIFRANPGDTTGSNYYLFVDEYGGRGYIPLGTDDLDQPDWKVPAVYDLPASPRHGTVIPVTQAELDSLREGIVVPEPPTPVEADENGLVAHYALDETTGSVAADSSGHGYDGTVAGDTTWADGGLSLGGTNGHVKLPDNMMAGLDAITVSTEVWVDATQPTPYFIWGLGNTDGGGTGNGYLFTTGNSAYRTSIASGNWTTEQTATSGSALGRGAWKNLTYTLQDGTATLYLDGVQVGQKTGVTIKPGDIGEGRTTANYIGRSVYAGDKYLKGKVRDFRLYNRALTGTEVRDLAADPSAILGVELGSLKVPAVIDSASSTVTLPVEPGTDRTALDPSYDVKAGSTLDVDGPADYSTPRTVTVTAPGGATRAWTVRAVEMRSPVLPGLYADPNIAVFNGTYYIYATTDGVAGWGGKDFYVWKSTNLVDWERSEQPFLTLDGANGNVPWASGNAWAPTIIERGGKYYFYFSGHNPTYNRKTIGVAVADSPEGPFTAQPTAMILNNEAVTSGQAIDPAAFQDPATGKYYLFWGNGSPVYAELSDDMLSIKAETLGRITGLTSFREGTFVNYRQGTYHLTYSIDDTGSPDYRVGYATATSIDGPWTYRGVILQKDPSQGILGTGHSSIVNVPGTDEWYIAYHRFGMPGGDGTHRETTIDELTFGEDGLMQVVTPTLTSVDALEEPEPEAPANTALPTIAGTAQVGRKLVAKPGTWDQSGLSFSYRWLRDGTTIAGAASASYTPRAADVGHKLSVQVTATPATGPAGTATSAPTKAVAKAGSTVRLRLSDTTPRAGQRVVLRISVGSTPAGVAVAGRVTVKVDGRQVAVPVLRSGVATVTLRLPKGAHAIGATYRGSTSVAADAAVLRVRVSR